MIKAMSQQEILDRLSDLKAKSWDERERAAIHAAEILIGKTRA